MLYEAEDTLGILSRVLHVSTFFAARNETLA